MLTVMDRLQSSPALFGDASRVERSHRTVVARADAPRCHVVDGDDTSEGPKIGCEVSRTTRWSVRLFVRDDDGYSAGDEFAQAVLDRLNPENDGLAPYPAGIVPIFDDMRIDEEVADADALRIELTFRGEYRAPPFSLG